MSCLLVTGTQGRERGLDLINIPLLEQSYVTHTYSVWMCCCKAVGHSVISVFEYDSLINVFKNSTTQLLKSLNSEDLCLQYTLFNFLGWVRFLSIDVLFSYKLFI